MRVLEDLGVHPIEAFQSDAFVIVEGTTDEPRLSSLLPLEFGRVFTFVAGTGRDVEGVVKMLNIDALPIPHLGIRDRDYLTTEQAEALEAATPNLCIWSRRSVENEILYPPLIAKTLERIGRHHSEEEIVTRLRQLADEQREAVTSELVEASLRSRHAYTRAGDTVLERQKHHLEEVRRVAQAKLEEMDDVVTQVKDELDQRWADEFLSLADGKRLLSEFVEFTGFRNIRDLLSALGQTVHDHPDLLPPAFVRLRERMKAILPTTPDS
jgi:hypothetical protein